MLEDVSLQKVRYLYKKSSGKNLCLAGGVALNVVANGHCLREGRFDHLSVPCRW